MRLGVGSAFFDSLGAEATVRIESGFDVTNLKKRDFSLIFCAFSLPPPLH
jgi:hypothetical protein